MDTPMEDRPIKWVILAGSFFTFFVCCSSQFADAADVKEAYAQQCARCHGDQGKGDGPTLTRVKGKALDWTDKAAMLKVDDEYLFKSTADGGAGVSKSKLMPAYGKKMDEKAIKEMVSFIRSLAK